MKAESIKKYLRPSPIMGRKSTFSNAFASALAPHDEFNILDISEALNDLAQDVDNELVCVYCGDLAATWDHVFNRVQKGEFSGYGHRIRNLVPCCRSCNERKGSKHWRDFLDIINPADKAVRVTRLEKFVDKDDTQPIVKDATRHASPAELTRFLEIRSQIFEMMAEADRLAVIIRRKSSR